MTLPHDIIVLLLLTFGFISISVFRAFSVFSSGKFEDDLVRHGFKISDRLESPAGSLILFDDANRNLALHNGIRKQVVSYGDVIEYGGQPWGNIKSIPQFYVLFTKNDIKNSVVFFLENPYSKNKRTFEKYCACMLDHLNVEVLQKPIGKTSKKCFIVQKIAF